MGADDNAIVLIEDIRAALARGTKHFAIDGTPLLTDVDILQALLKDRSIIFEPADEPEEA
jgi:hypothetical protein